MLSGTTTLPSAAGTAETGTRSLTFPSPAAFPESVTLKLLLTHLCAVKSLMWRWGGGRRTGDQGVTFTEGRVTPLQDTPGHHSRLRGGTDLPWSGVSLRAKTDHEPFPHASGDSLAPPAALPHRAVPTPVLKELVPDGCEPQGPTATPPTGPLIPALSPQNASDLRCQ